MKNTVTWMAAFVVCVAGIALAADQEAKPAGEIIFARDSGNGWRIWTVNSDGSDLRQLISGAKENEMDVDPMFSPDGRKVLFTSTRGGTSALWIANIDGSDSKKVCDGREGEWSPDGQSVAFVKDNAVFVRNLASGEERQIVPKGYEICAGPAWSPDGKTIGFASRKNGPNGMYLVPASGGEPTVLLEKKGKSVCQPHWSPDGKKIVYETETNIATVQPDGTKPRPLTSFGGIQRYGRWSPDGSKVVFCQGTSESGPWELYIIPATGGAPTKLTEGASDLNPDWKPAPKGK